MRATGPPAEASPATDSFWSPAPFSHGMYVSHPVRRMGQDPVEGETVELVLTVDTGEATPEGVGDRIEAVGGKVVAELPFDSLHVSVAQEDVGDVCEVAGLERVETANTISLGGDP